ncbi:squamosa promoter-binding protein 15 [Nocardia sp. NPDC058176]|uniref:squamosa promoter-binding protein 15 n=1 Tax=Nocardia sp. NPDC058176 TaxID=3346368 RepID=UPI0036DA4709
MSSVTNVMLSVSYDDRPQAAQLSLWLESNGRTHGSSLRGCGSLREISREAVLWGGTKRPECEVWAGVLDHADLSAVLAAVAGTAWVEPDSVQLLLMDQHDFHFQLWMVREGVWRQYAPPNPEGSAIEFGGGNVL